MVFCSTGVLAASPSDEAGFELVGVGAASWLDDTTLDVDEPFDWQLTAQHINTQANTAWTAPSHMMTSIADQCARTVNADKGPACSQPERR